MCCLDYRCLCSPNDPTSLYSDLVTDSLTEFSYDADLAGLSYSFVAHTSGLYVSMSGYNDKMSVLVKHILDKVKHIVLDPARLAVIKEQVETAPFCHVRVLKFL